MPLNLHELNETASGPRHSLSVSVLATADRGVNDSTATVEFEDLAPTTTLEDACQFNLCRRTPT